MSSVSYSISAHARHDAQPPPPATEVVPTPERSGANFLPAMDSPGRRENEAVAGVMAKMTAVDAAVAPAGGVAAVQQAAGRTGARSARRGGSGRRGSARGAHPMQAPQHPLVNAVASVRLVP
jgi:hypothetical protein